MSPSSDSMFKADVKTIKLIGVNAKYSHICLAIRCLRAAAPCPVSIAEVTINDTIQGSAALILSEQADIYGFSCTIWNMERVLQLVEVLKLSQPDCAIYLGGPEVSYDALELLDRYEFVDGIFCGEGEEAFFQFCQYVRQNRPIMDIPGLQLRGETKTSLQIVSTMTRYPFPYTDEELFSLRDRILYYESMRGCPFKCAYCLSSTLPGGVRCLPLERVQEDLNRFMSAKVRQVKFVDRTFNVYPDRAKAILSFLAEAETDTNFHFEMAADLMDEEMLSIIAKAPKGRFQFEIGIQSTDAVTLDAITRKTDLDLVKKRICQLVAIGNSHVHVDLIAGLPYEGFNTFGVSYDETMALRPHMLQLGFLKLLKGTAIRQNAEKHHYRYTSFPPYEVIANDYISAQELRILKGIEELTELYYNSGSFVNSLEYIFRQGWFNSPFIFFKNFWVYWQAQGFHLCAHSTEALYGILGEYFFKTTHDPLIWQLLAYDAFLYGMKHLPKGLPCEPQPTKEACFEIAKDDDLFRDHFPELADFAPKKRVKYIQIHRFDRSFQNAMKLPGDVGVFYKGQAAFTTA